MINDKLVYRFYFNWIVFLIYIPIVISGFYGYKTQWGNNPMTVTGLIVTNSFFLIILSMMYCCSFKMDNNNIIIKLGIGLYRKKISINNIKTVELIENKYNFSPKASNLKDCREFNVAFLEKKAILFRLKDKRTGIIIGFKDSEELLREIEKKINDSQQRLTVIGV